MENEAQPEAFVTRVGLIGDVHGHSAALTAALQWLAAQPALDALLCTGDLPGRHGDGDTNRACRLLAEYGVRTVAGNHDRWAVENGGDRVLLGISDEWPLAADVVAFLRTLPQTRAFRTPLGPALLGHGTGADDLCGVYPTDDERALEANIAFHALWTETHYRILFAGHTHQRMVRRCDHLTIVNAAALADEGDAVLPTRVSPGTALRRKNPCFAIVDLGAGFVQYYNIARDSMAVTQAEIFPL